MYQRYAVYVTPTGPLAETGARWLGWDSASGSSCEHPKIPGVDLSRVTATPRKYGLHGTIKPPFFLADGADVDQLERSLVKLCRTLPPVNCGQLKVSQMGRFIALTPVERADELSKVASAVVAGLDTFRAPLTDAEIAKRKPETLPPAKRENLYRWGYPHVMDAFRFHITLTGPLSAEEQEAVMPAVHHVFGPWLSQPFHITHLTLCGQDRAGMFHQIKTAHLKGTPN